MNSTQLECFVCVANNLNFARAAEEMHITQPAVTHQINSLENELGVVLFKRTTRSVALTPDGFSLIEDAQHILRAMHVAKTRLSSGSNATISFFSIGFHSPSELTMLPDILQEFHKKYPQVHPSLKTLPFRSLENFLENGSLDVMFDFENDRRSHKNDSFCELFQTRIMCAMSKDHPLATRESLDARDLLSHPVILQEAQRTPPALYALQKPLEDNHGLTDTYYCEGMEAAVALAAAGLGIALVLDLTPLRHPNLCYRPLLNAPTLSYGIHYKRQPGNLMLQDFLTAAKHYFATVLPY